MQEENVMPSNRTLHYLGTFLKEFKHPVPFEIPEESHGVTTSLPVSYHLINLL